MSSRRRKHKKSRKKLAYGVIAVAFVFLCFLIYFSLHQSNQTSDGNAIPPEAAIVDHLNFTGQSNPTFVEECINILKSGGLTWKYYKGENVTVDFYRNLPSYGTSLIILRVHSAIMRTENGTISLLGLFTSELYSPGAARKYPEDVKYDRLVRAFFPGGDEEYFGIVPEFVEKSMKGEFKNTTIIMMGCEGLGYDGQTYTDMAEAFINKGAKVYISWNGRVSVNHTDQATLCLLQSLILENQTIKEAVTKTMKEVGPDLTFEPPSRLEYYPDKAGSYAIPNFKSSLAMNVAYTPPAPKALKRTKYLAHE